MKLQPSADDQISDPPATTSKSPGPTGTTVLEISGSTPGVPTSSEVNGKTVTETVVLGAMVLPARFLTLLTVKLTLFPVRLEVNVSTTVFRSLRRFNPLITRPPE